MMDETAKTEEGLKKLDACIEQIEEMIGLPEVSTNAAARVYFEEAIEQLKEARKKIEEGPRVH